MADLIGYEAKTDRELLLLAVAKINDLDMKLDTTCGLIDSTQDDVDDVSDRVTLLEDRVRTQGTTIKLLIGGVITITTAVIVAFLGQLGIQVG